MGKVGTREVLRQREGVRVVQVPHLSGPHSRRGYRAAMSSKLSVPAATTAAAAVAGAPGATASCALTLAGALRRAGRMPGAAAGSRGLLMYLSL